MHRHALSIRPPYLPRHGSTTSEPTPWTLRPSNSSRMFVRPLAIRCLDPSRTSRARPADPASPTQAAESIMRHLLAGFVLVASLACGGDSSTNPANASIAGTYRLSTVNGSALPYTLQSGLTKVVITSDVLTVADGGTWSETTSATVTVNGQTSSQVVPDGGTWTRSGSSVTFNSTTTHGATGTFTRSGFNLSDGTNSLVYVRQ